MFFKLRPKPPEDGQQYLVNYGVHCDHQPINQFSPHGNGWKYGSAPSSCQSRRFQLWLWEWRDRGCIKSPAETWLPSTTTLGPGNIKNANIADSKNCQTVRKTDQITLAFSGVICSWKTKVGFDNPELQLHNTGCRIHHQKRCQDRKSLVKGCLPYTQNNQTIFAKVI